MGCYGIGVGRLAASICEESHDDYGPIWPISIAPWQVEICNLRNDNEEVTAIAEKLYDDLGKMGVEVLYDDRNIRPGAMFADADLFGVPLDALVRGETKTYAKDAPAALFRKSRVAITALSLSLVWLFAVAAFILLGFMPSIKGEWLAFVAAAPISAIVWLVLNSVWFNRRINYLIISLLVWSLLAAAHLILLVLGYNLWQIYLLGIPGQVIILIWSHLTVKIK